MQNVKSLQEIYVIFKIKFNQIKKKIIWNANSKSKMWDFNFCFVSSAYKVYYKSNKFLYKRSEKLITSGMDKFRCTVYILMLRYFIFEQLNLNVNLSSVNRFFFFEIYICDWSGYSNILCEPFIFYIYFKFKSKKTSMNLFNEPFSENLFTEPNNENFLLIRNYM